MARRLTRWVRFHYQARVRNAWSNRCLVCVVNPFHSTPESDEDDPIGEPDLPGGIDYDRFTGLVEVYERDSIELTSEQAARARDIAANRKPLPAPPLPSDEHDKR